MEEFRRAGLPGRGCNFRFPDKIRFPRSVRGRILLEPKAFVPQVASPRS